MGPHQFPNSPAVSLQGHKLPGSMFSAVLARGSPHTPTCTHHSFRFFISQHCCPSCQHICALRVIPKHNPGSFSSLTHNSMLNTAPTPPGPCCTLLPWAGEAGLALPGQAQVQEHWGARAPFSRVRDLGQCC